MLKKLSTLTIILIMVSALLIPSSKAQQPFSEMSKHRLNNQITLDTAKLKSLEFISFAIRGTEYNVDSTKDLKIKSTFFDELTMVHTRLQQTSDNVPVFGGEAIVHLNPDGSLFSITNSIVPHIQVNTNPDISMKEAIDRAINLYGCFDCLTSEPQAELWILRHKNKDHLVYRVQLERVDGSKHTAMPIYFIDAHTGNKVWSYNNLQTATGSSLYSGQVNITTSSVGSTFYMEDLTRKMGTFNMNNGASTSIPGTRFTDADNIWNSTDQRAAVDAHFGAAMVFDYYKNVHGRVGIDGNGGPLTSNSGSPNVISSKVHYGSAFNNAFWDPNTLSMYYGDGNNITFSPLVTLDVVGHELTHGVTQFTANLIYANESGALNESMSDVFGAMIERYARGGAITADTWKIGEQCYTPSNGTSDALRYMNNPHLAANSGLTSDDDPDHYSERYTGIQDNGGVHINSGIGNHAFYLLAQGGTHHKGGSMSGIGADAAAKIWYLALTSYMTSSTNYLGARNATLNAAAALYGQNGVQYNAVQQAWLLVGVGTSTPPTPTATKDTIGVYYGPSATFKLKNSNAAGLADITFSYGAANNGWIPIVGDFNGDNIDTVGLYDPATATFYLRNSNTGGVANITFTYGVANNGWIPIVGDFNGDKIDTIGLYDPATATYYLRNSVSCSEKCATEKRSYACD